MNNGTRGFAIVSLSVLLLLLIFLRIKNQVIAEDITLKTNYMMYACGECYDQHQIKQVLDSDKNYDYLIGKNISIKYPSKELYEEIYKKVELCIICYEFTATGEITYSRFSGRYTLDALKVEAILPDKNCCN